jgi:hypothetical protein
VLAADVLFEIRSRGATVCRVGDRLGVEPAQVLDDALRAAIREHRDQLLSLVEGGGGCQSPPENSCNTATLADRTAAQWRARFEILAASRMFVEGYERNAARSWAYYDVLVEWTEQHPDVDALPNSQAEPIARMALAEIGIFEPKGVSR